MFTHTMLGAVKTIKSHNKIKVIITHSSDWKITRIEVIDVSESEWG